MRKNNFDFLRLVFATLVLVTHSYVLSGSSENDILGIWTSGQINCSSLGVKGFFIISGYLIFQSAFRSRSWRDYIIKRILRIYPGYIAVLIFAVVLAFCLSDHNLRGYLADNSVWSYLGNNIAMFLPLHYQIDSVFGTNVYKYAINGSIWTIPYEFFFYIILSFVFALKKWPELLTAALAFFYIIIFLWTVKYEDRPGIDLLKNIFDIHLLAHFALCFFGGALLASLRVDLSKYKTYFLIGSCVMCIIFIATKTFYFTQFAILPLIIVLTGSHATKGIAGLNSKIGDFSYGIYLYGFIVQQTLEHFFKFNCWKLMITSIPISFIFGALSWFLIEKRALQAKKYFP